MTLWLGRMRVDVGVDGGSNDDGGGGRGDDDAVAVSRSRSSWQRARQPRGRVGAAAGTAGVCCEASPGS